MSARRIPAAAGLFFLVAAPLVPGVPEYWITVLNLIGLAALVALGLVLLTGVGGLTSFGQAAFAGFAAYTTAILTTQYGVSPWLTLPVALAVTAAAAIPLGLITLPLSGHFLPLGTIAWGLGLYYAFGKLEITGGFDGIAPIPPLSVAGYDFFGGRSIYFVIWGFVIVAVLLAANLLDSRIGRAIRALRAGGAAAEAFGVSTFRVKLVVFVLAAVLAGLSGWLFAHMQRAVNPTPFGLGAGIEYLLMAVVGGAGAIGGAIFGAAFVILLDEALLRTLPVLFGTEGNYETIVFGVILVAVLMSAREGLWPRIVGLLPPPPDPPRPLTDEPLARRPMPPAGVELLSVEGLSKQFGGLKALDRVGFAVRAGEIVGLIGPNGAGKSTTFNLITGLLPPTAGTIAFAGTPLGDVTPQQVARLGIARTFQHARIVPEMSVLENVALGATLRGEAGVARSLARLDRREEARLLAAAADQVERVGLGEAMFRPAGALPLGQIRLVEIARALALDPVLLLLDEPAAGLRHQEKDRLAALLRQLKGEGMAILLVEHDMRFVMGLTDHIVVLDFGVRIAEGDPKAVAANPAVIEAYLGAAA